MSKQVKNHCTVPIHSAGEVLKIKSVICDSTPLTKVLCHTVLVAVLVDRGALMAVAVGVLASVSVLSLHTGTATGGSPSFNSHSYSEIELGYTVENI